jgi:hypothetical protein
MYFVQTSLVTICTTTDLQERKQAKEYWYRETSNHSQCQILKIVHYKSHKIFVQINTSVDIIPVAKVPVR